VLPDPTVPLPLAPTSTGARSQIRPGGTWSRAFPWVVACSDLFVVTAVVTIMVWWSGELITPDRMVAAGLVAGMALTTLVGVRRGYDHRRILAGGFEYRAVVRAGWIWASLLLAALYF